MQDFDENESQIILSHPSEYFYMFYANEYGAEPDEFIGSWSDFSSEELDFYLSPELDSVHRIRLDSHDDSNLNSILSLEFDLVRESSSKGMAVEHWVRKNG